MLSSAPLAVEAQNEPLLHGAPTVVEPNRFTAESAEKYLRVAVYGAWLLQAKMSGGRAQIRSDVVTTLIAAPVTAITSL